MAREEMAQRLLHGRHGIRQRLPGPQPLHGPQAGRLPPHPARPGKRTDDPDARHCATTRRRHRPRWAPSRSTPYPHALARYAEVAAALAALRVKDGCQQVFEKV